MGQQTVGNEHRGRVAEYAALLPDIAALQVFGQHALVAAGLAAIARRRVADHIDGQRSLEEVAAAAGVDPSVLHRLARFLQPHGLFEVIDGRLALTPKGRLLRSDSPVWPGLALRGANDAAWALDHTLGTGEPAFPRVFRADFWAFLDRSPDDREAFAVAMRLNASLLAVACLPAVDLTGVGTVADIGGGTGDLLAAVLEAYPEVRGILVDRPDMLDRAHPALRTGVLAGRVELRAGDLFGEPPPADAYLLAQVLHNWNDEAATRLLQNLRRAARPCARLFVLTMLVPENAGPHPSTAADVGMLALFGGGRERTESETRTLLAATGWRVDAVTPTRVAAVVAATA
jgi:SAM-dependent methyltransferase